MNRRTFLQTAALGGSVAALAASTRSARAANQSAVIKGRLKQSIVQWCFESYGEKWSVAKTCQVARTLGCKSVELVAPSFYPTLKEYGLTCAIGQIDLSPDLPFIKGWNNPDHWPRLMKATRDALDAAAAFGMTSVICFTGNSAKNPDDPQSPKIPKDVGLKNCVNGLKEIVGYAEKCKVTLCLEMINSRDPVFMKGAPDYQGDHTDYCMDIIRQVGSDRLKFLFDIFHVQIMDGDLIRRIRELKDFIAHVHTAGNPGRGELDQNQEINYRPLMQALVDIGYAGYVGHEFIPTRDPFQGLREAVSLCDV